MIDSNHRMLARLRLVVLASGLIVILIGAVGLVGWMFDITALKSAQSGPLSTKANTALGLILAGAALLLAARKDVALWRRRGSLVCAAVVTLLGLLTLGEYIFDSDFGIDQALFRDPSEVMAPGRMGPNTALCLALTGGALLLLDARRRSLEQLAEGVTLAAALLALVGLVGYVYGATYLTQIASAAPMALQTDLAFIVLCAGLIAARPHRPFAALLMSASPGGLLLRRLLPQLILLLIALCWLWLLGERAGLYEAYVGAGLLVVILIVIFGLLIWRAAQTLDELDNARRKSETERQQAVKAIARLAAIVESSDDAIISVDLNGCITSWNKGAEMLYGYAAGEIIGKPIKTLIPLDRVDEEVRILESIRRGEKIDHYETVRRRKDGSLFEISLAVSPLRGEEGKIIGASKIARDITKRKQAERELAESARQQQALYQFVDQLHHAQSLDEVYNAALDASLSALQCDRASILLFDDTGVMRFVAWRGLSDAYRKVVEGHSPWKPDEKHPAPIAVSDIDAAGIDDSLKVVIKNEGIGALAFIPLVSNGKLIGKFMTYLNAPHVFSDDELEFSLTIARQLAFGVDRKRAEDLLLQNARRLALIANTAPVLIAQCDAQARFKFVNTAYAERFGLRPEDCVGKRIPEVVGAEAYQSFRQHVEEVLRGEPVEFEVEIPYATIGRRFMHCSYAPEFDANGKVVGLVAAITDMTDRRRAEESLRYHLDLTQTITDNTQSCLWMMNAEGRCTFANPASEHISGFKPEELIGEVLHYKVHHTRPDGTPFPIDECPLDRALPLQESVVGYEDTFIHKDGHFYPVRCAGRPIFKGGRPVGTVIEVQDITEEKRLLEAERRAREQAEVANRLKDEFLATVSHELRTPLNAILGWTVMLRSGRLTPEKAAEALETIERSARAQNRLVEDLLDVSRIVTGKVQLKFQPVVVARVVESAVAAARPAAEAKSINLQVTLDSMPCEVTGDADRVQQVVWNLISNAVKFTPKGGRVEARVKCVDSHVEIKVSDTGEGIAPEFLPHVFDRFRQADGSIQRRHGGLGLGLAIVRHLVELHGGEVSVESAGLGRGATFSVKLPIAAAWKADFGMRDEEESVAPNPQSKIGETSPQLEDVKVLVVDDEADARALLREILAGCGAEVRTAGNMTEALSLLNEWRPDVLVSDIGMPGGSGYDLIREVRRRDTIGARLPAVALTAYARTEDRVQALSAGFHMHLSKPVEPNELLAVIASLTS